MTTKKKTDDYKPEIGEEVEVCYRNRKDVIVFTGEVLQISELEPTCYRVRQKAPWGYTSRWCTLDEISPV